MDQRRLSENPKLGRKVTAREKSGKEGDGQGPDVGSSEGVLADLLSLLLLSAHGEELPPHLGLRSTMSGTNGLPDLGGPSVSNTSNLDEDSQSDDAEV